MAYFMTLSTSYNIALNNQMMMMTTTTTTTIMNTELESTQELSWPNFLVLSHHLPDRTEENHEKPQSGYSVSWPIS
jgi:hypothetical protein